MQVEAMAMSSSGLFEHMIFAKLRSELTEARCDAAERRHTTSDEGE